MISHSADCSYHLRQLRIPLSFQEEPATYFHFVPSSPNVQKCDDFGKTSTALNNYDGRRLAKLLPWAPEEEAGHLGELLKDFTTLI